MKRWVGTVFALSLLVSACSTAVDGDPVAPQGEAGKHSLTGACNSTTAPLLELDPVDDAEPRLAVPQPQGWDRQPDLESKVYRLFMTAGDLRSDNFTPTMNLGIEELSGQAPDAKAAVALERDGLNQLNATDFVEKHGTVCGLPSLTVTYTMPQTDAVPPHPVSGVVVGVEVGKRVFAVFATIQSLHPDDPTYAADSKTIMDGLQILAPTVTT